MKWLVGGNDEKELFSDWNYGSGIVGRRVWKQADADGGAWRCGGAGFQEHYISAEEDQAVPMVEVVYSEDEAYPALAAFLKEYYQIPDEYCSETRYYYNYTDLNEDGEQDICGCDRGIYRTAIGRSGAHSFRSRRRCV